MTSVFLFFALMAVSCGVGVVVARSPVASLLFMVATLASIAGIYIVFEAHFLGAVQVLVYAGAIMVLFLFVIMLLNLGSDYAADLKYGLWFLAASVVGSAAGAILFSRLSMAEAVLPVGSQAPETIDQLIRERGAVGALAEPLFTDYVVAFELMGLLLLVAIVAAVALAKPRDKKPEVSDASG